MIRPECITSKSLILVVFVSLCLSGAAAENEKMLFDFGKGFDVGAVETRDVKIKLTGVAGASALRIASGHAVDWPGITLAAPDGKWNLATFEYVALDVKNTGANRAAVSCRIDNPGADGAKRCVTAGVDLNPGETKTLKARLYGSSLALTEDLELVGMRGAPGRSAGFDPANVTQLLVFVPKPDADHTFEISNVRAGGAVQLFEAKKFLPFIDEFGQFIHKDWPGKTHSLEELKGGVKKEEGDLAAHPGPKQRNQYGGWTGGPTLEASGFFRVEKHQGKWWLVDPEGRLFWSHGVDCVRSWGGTPISRRENYFKALPAKDSPLARFYGWGNWGPHGFYKDMGRYRQYNFGSANALRKYGDDWEEQLAGLAHRRLRSWGMNTIANWSDGNIYLQRKTPYTATAGTGGPRIEGSEGYWGKFPDPFHPEFRQATRSRMEREKGRTAGDPWCLGFFVDNELGWGKDGMSLALAALASPPAQPAKQAFLADLKKKYGEIAKLNAAWGASHASWDALRDATEAPNAKKAKADLEAFYDRIAEEYFRVVREEVKRVAPNQLYLGCRFAWVNDRATRAAAKFCDVIGFNRYEYSVAEFKLPDGVDKPVVIGEFHFGALDRGMFHTGLKAADNQEHRAQLYEDYVRGALRNPVIVGTHWFQYQDQATTGRGDGENYQIGFVDICGAPNPEIVAASRRVGADMYPYRLRTD